MADLGKKIAEIEQLEAKQAAGSTLQPNQLWKISHETAMRRELNDELNELNELGSAVSSGGVGLVRLSSAEERLRTSQAVAKRLAAEADTAAMDAELSRTSSAISALQTKAAGDSDRRTAVVYDMETGDPDDFLCLLFLASHPRIRLKAVTINPGSADQVGLVRWALELFGLGGLPVGAGNINYPKDCVSPWHSRAFFGGSKIPRSTDAEEAWCVMLRECDARTTIFTGGALTNVAITIKRGGEKFVAERLVAQGGYVGDNIVPPEWQLPKFAGKTYMQTFNFGSDLEAAHISLKHTGFGSIWLVGKNVCHSSSNGFGSEQLQRLRDNLQARGVPKALLCSPTEVMRRTNNPSLARHNAGLSLILIGMQTYLARKAQKLLHDPLAAATLVDSSVISMWRQVQPRTESLHGPGKNCWGSVAADHSHIHAAIRHDADRFWGVFLGEILDGSHFGAPVSEPQPEPTPTPEPMAQTGLGSSIETAQKLLAKLDTIEQLKMRHAAGVTLDSFHLSAIAKEQHIRVRLGQLGFASAAPRVEVLFAEAIAQGWVQRTAVENMLTGLVCSVQAGKRTEQECVELVQSRICHMRQLVQKRKAKAEQLCVADSVPHSTGTPAGTSMHAHPRDWEGMKLPRFVQPAKPKQNEGLNALAKLAQDPYARPERVLLVTTHCVVAYDLYPKAKVHVLILPRCPLNGPEDLRPEHEPLLRHMTELCQWLAPRLRAQFRGLPPLRCGFHAVPSMQHLHLHLISLDMDSIDLKRPRHWHIFNTDYLVPPHLWAQQLTLHGRVSVNVAAEKAKAKATEMQCPLTDLIFRSMSDLRKHLRSKKYRQQVDAINTDLTYIDDLGGVGDAAAEHSAAMLSSRGKHGSRTA